MTLVYDVYVQSAPYGPAGFGVDAQLSDKNYLSQESTGYSFGPLDSRGYDCSAGSLPTTVGAWIQVECDLSAFHDLTISALLLDYVNYGYVSTAATYTAYFDSIRLIKTPEPRDLANGNFEDSTLYGWLLYTQAKPTVSTSVVDVGNQSIKMQLSPSTCTHDGGCYYTELASQEFRVPNYVDSTSSPLARTLNLTGFVYYTLSCVNPNCPTSSNATVSFEDKTAPDRVLGTVVSTSMSGWAPFTPINTTSVEGHDVLLDLSLHAFAADGVSIGTVVAYFDDIELVPFGALLQENGSTSTQSYTGQILLPFKVYNPSCGGGRYAGNYAWTFDAPFENQAWNVQPVQWSTSSPGQYIYTQVTSNLTIGADLRSVTHTCSASSDSIVLGLSTDANATGLIQRPSNSVPTTGDWGRAVVLNMCLGVQEVQKNGDPVYFSPSAVGPQNTVNLGSTSPGVGAAPVQDSYTAQDFAVSSLEDVAVLVIEGTLLLTPETLPALVFVAVLPLALNVASGLLGNLYGSATGGGSSSICTLSGSNLWGEQLTAALYSSIAQITIGASLFAGCMNSQGQNSCSSSPAGGTYLITVVAQANLGCWSTSGGYCTGLSTLYYATETATLNIRLSIR